MRAAELNSNAHARLGLTHTCALVIRGGHADPGGLHQCQCGAERMEADGPSAFASGPASLSADMTRFGSHSLASEMGSLRVTDHCFTRGAARKHPWRFLES